MKNLLEFDLFTQKLKAYILFPKTKIVIQKYKSTFF